MAEENFQLTSKGGKTIFTLIGLGVMLFVIGALISVKVIPEHHNSGAENAEHHTETVADHHSSPTADAHHDESHDDHAEAPEEAHSEGGIGSMFFTNPVFFTFFALLGALLIIGSGAGQRKLLFGSGALILLAVLLALLIGSGHESSEALHGAGGHGSKWKRVFANLWLNNVYFTGVALIGIFFVAVQYIAKAGWATVILRVPEAFGNWLPFAGMLMLIFFLSFGDQIFHWTDSRLYDPADAHYDEIIAGKSGYLNLPFYLIRMVGAFLIWFLLYRKLRKHSLQQDLDGDLKHHKKSIVFSAIFIVVFAATSSTSAWDWVMSIDTHWFSTMFGWYVFASWFVTGLSAITLTVVLLKENGYLKAVKESHLHDLGKFMFAFSIFWTYIWFCQFLLIYYANLPEETTYFIDRISNYGGHYQFLFFISLFINFIFPFLVLMTRDAKRKMAILKIVAVALMLGHWVDFYMMIMPGTLQGNSGFGLLEIGTFILFASLFALIIAKSLAKASLVPKHHPMLEESKHLHT